MSSDGMNTQDGSTGISDRIKEVGDTLRQSTEKVSETGAALGMKLLDQAETNTREAFAAMRAAAQAKDVSEIVKIQGDFLREQSGRAMSQVREISDMITSFGRDAMGQMTRHD